MLGMLHPVRRDDSHSSDAAATRPTCTLEMLLSNENEIDFTFHVVLQKRRFMRWRVTMSAATAVCKLRRRRCDVIDILYLHALYERTHIAFSTCKTPS